MERGRMFLWAMEHAAMGAKVRRSAWLEDEHVFMSRNVTLGKSRLRKVTVMLEYGIIHRWYTPTIEDMFNNDWGLM